MGRKKKSTKFIIEGNDLVGILEDGNHFVTDADLFEKIKKYYWRRNERGYIYTTIKVNGKNKSLLLHRLIIEAKENEIIDHIDRNKLNNRLSNLRKVNYQESNRNNVKRKDNTSGYTGIYWEPKKKLWRAYLYINGKRKSLGRHKSKENAIKARLKGELQYYGKDFAPQRDLFEKYGIL